MAAVLRCIGHRLRASSKASALTATGCCGSVPDLHVLRRGFSSFPDPYKTLGLNRDASDADIKKAYRDQALRWHPDKQPEEQREEAQKRFSDASNAYEILKDPEKRQEYDLRGSVGTGPHHPGAGFQGNVHPADVEQLLREAFGQQGLEHLMQQLRQQGQGQGQQPFGCRGRQQRPRGVLQQDMEVRIRPDVASIHSASRASHIDMENDERRARYAGHVGTIVKADPEDRSVKLRVMVSPGRADEVWFGADAVWIPDDLEVDTEVQICPDEATIHRASREVGIDAENDFRRARCAGKIGTVISIDRGDQSVKVRVLVLPGRADEVWFGAGALEPLSQRQDAHYQNAWARPSAEMRGFSSAA